MKNLLLTLLFLLQIVTVFGQKIKHEKKDRLFISWGWNRAAYSKADIGFKGPGYDFILNNVVAKDRQSKFDWFFIDPTQATIPQYNFRIGYYINPKYSISFGFDHMKYVVQADQQVTINGHIDTGSKYDGQYENQPIRVAKDFLQLEHTNGLNYLNLELRRHDKLTSFLKNKVELRSILGAGSGIMYPKTDATLLNFDRNDQWHLAGYGFSAVGGLNLTFFKNFFIQGEIKGGFINMPDILTTAQTADRAKENFFFLQRNFNFGTNIRF